LITSLGLDDSHEIIGKTDIELFGDEFGRKTMIDDMQVMQTGQPMVGVVEYRYLPGGEVNWTSTSKLPIRDENGEVIGLLGITREINELKHAELELQFLATHDVLTSLPNRYLVLDRMEQNIRRCKRNDGKFAVLYIDLDGFKGVNDRFGHDAGDQVLKQIADRMVSAVRDTDTVSRIGGDEFAIILEDVKRADNAMRVAQKIRAKIEEEINISETRVCVTASIGISLYPAHGTEASGLLKAADQAMYTAKKRNNACELFKPPRKPA
jgi:diguanylate cyclase (GGDEF)-like protein